MIAFFSRPYKVKRFGKERIVDGYTSSGYVDISPVPLDVQEQDYTVTSEANGKRSPKTLNAYGQFKFVAAESPETRGDLLLYKGQWYECTSCVEHCNTLLRHFFAVFQLDPNQGGYEDECE